MIRSIHRFVVLLLASLLLSQAAHAIDASGFEDIAIQEGGRKKPFLVFAHETMLGMTGKAKFTKED